MNTTFTTDIMNKTCTVWYGDNASESDFDACRAEIESAGYKLREETQICAAHKFFGYSKENDAVFINWFANVSQITIVHEKNCRYFDFADVAKDAKVTPQITQVHLEDFGMSYAIRLDDGRFVVIDGGREFEPDADRLFDCLKQGSPYDKPVIAAWILTHPHSDHHLCLQTFIDKYGDEVVVEKFLYNYPEADDFAHFSNIEKSDRRVERNTSPAVNIPRTAEYVKRMGAEHFIPHTGQVYQFADATFICLGCMEDGLKITQHFNAASLVFRMTLGGQVVLWAADASCEALQLAPKYKDFLKSDILQVPHHGFTSGNPDAEIEAYEYIRPSVCFLPVSDYNAYIVNCVFRPSARYMMENMSVDEWITGDPTRTIDLPYTPPAYKKAEHARKLQSGIAASGKKTWVFTNLNTGDDEDLNFTFLNMGGFEAKIWMEFFFEDFAQALRYVTVRIPRGTVKTINILGDEIDDADVWFNWMSIAARGVPENAPFAVRFLSDTPVVISHKNHKADYEA